jgi:hypothetical protein
MKGGIEREIIFEKKGTIKKYRGHVSLSFLLFVTFVSELLQRAVLRRQKNPFLLC